MDDYEREEPAKKENGGVTLLNNIMNLKSKATVEKGVLEYNNKDPEGLLEQFILPKERVIRKGENPDSEDVEL
jgi:hypothetical protein